MTWGGGVEVAGQSPAPSDPAPSSPNLAARIGLILCYLACATIPWTEVRVGGSLRIGDVFLLLALVFLLGAGLDQAMPRLPYWLWFFVATIVAVGLIREMFPAPDAYFNSRLTISGISITRGEDLSDSNLSVLIRFLIAVIGLPVIFNRAHFFDSRALTWSAFAFAAGSTINGLVAFTDSQGLTAIASQLGIGGAGGGRSAGLTSSPNYVAMACVFSLPIVLWQLVSPVTRNRVWAAIGLLGLLLGLYGSGSRSGGGAGVIAVVVPLLLVRRYRRSLPTVGLVLGFVLAAAFVVMPGLGDAVLKGLRITGDQGSGSDVARTVVNDQAMRDFLRAPIYGMGFRVAGESHIVYLQALATGGLILLTGLALYLLGAMVRCLRQATSSDFAAALFASILAGAVFNAAQNALTVRIVYVPTSIAAALPLLRLTGSGSQPPDGDAAGDHTAHRAAESA